MNTMTPKLPVIVQDGVTVKQFETLEWIRDFQVAHAYSPTLAELATAFGISTTSTLQRLRALEQRGVIRRRRYASRAIDIIRPPESLRVSPAIEIIEQLLRVAHFQLNTQERAAAIARAENFLQEVSR
jgi:SOS-response transcriptional repressor LexA